MLKLALKCFVVHHRYDFFNNSILKVYYMLYVKYFEFYSILVILEGNYSKGFKTIVFAFLLHMDNLIVLIHLIIC